MEISTQKVKKLKTIEVEEEYYLVTMTKDELKLLAFYVNNTVGSGYWRDLATNIYAKLDNILPGRLFVQPNLNISVTFVPMEKS